MSSSKRISTKESHQGLAHIINNKKTHQRKRNRKPKNRRLKNQRQIMIRSQMEDLTQMENPYQNQINE